MKFILPLVFLFILAGCVSPDIEREDAELEQQREIASNKPKVDLAGQALEKEFDQVDQPLVKKKKVTK